MSDYATPFLNGAGSAPKLILIAAVARNGVIGKENGLPWRLKADLHHFKQATMGQAILMGRNTWESLGRVLPGRRHLVVTRDVAYRAEGVEVFASIEAALEATSKLEVVYVIGGAQIYEQTIDRADKLLITEVEADIDGDAYFPAISPLCFAEKNRASYAADDANEYNYHFVEYART